MCVCVGGGELVCNVCVCLIYKEKGTQIQRVGFIQSLADEASLYYHLIAFQSFIDREEKDWGWTYRHNYYFHMHESICMIPWSSTKTRAMLSCLQWHCSPTHTDYARILHHILNSWLVKIHSMATTTTLHSQSHRHSSHMNNQVVHHLYPSWPNCSNPYSHTHFLLYLPFQSPILPTPSTPPLPLTHQTSSLILLFHSASVELKSLPILSNPHLPAQPHQQAFTYWIPRTSQLPHQHHQCETTGKDHGCCSSSFSNWI